MWPIIVLIVMAVLILIVIHFRPKDDDEEPAEGGCEKVCNEHENCRVYETDGTKKCMYT